MIKFIPDGLYGGGWLFVGLYPDCTLVALVFETCSGADGLAALLVPVVLVLVFDGTFHPILL